MVVSRKPARSVAAHTSTNCGRLATISATASPVPRPRARRARTTRLALALSSAQVRSPSGERMAGRSPRRAAQNDAVIPTAAAAPKAASSSAGSASAAAGPPTVASASASVSRASMDIRRSPRFARCHPKHVSSGARRRSLVPVGRPSPSSGPADRPR